MAGATTHPPTLEKSALVVIDVQQEYGPQGALGLEGLEPALHNIALLESLFRSRERPVVHVAHVGPTGSLFDPAAGGRFFELTEPVCNEPTVLKTLPNSFAGTDLLEVVTTNDVEDLVLVGFMTHMCVSSTARAALALGYPTTVVSDASATRDLPAATGDGVVPAAVLHSAALAALADRFSVVTTTQRLLQVAGSK